MMEYSTFKEIVSDRIFEFLPRSFKDYYPVIKTVTKVNETKDALTLKTDVVGGKKAMPIIYLDDMYEIFQISEDIDDILECCSEIIVNFSDAFENPDIYRNFKAHKDKIVPNLINTEMNEGLLKNVPHMEILDMSVIYRIMHKSPRGGFDTCVVTDDILKDLGVDNVQLHELAISNMKKVLPVEMSRITRDKSNRTHPEIPDAFTFISTEQKLFGAAYMLCEDILKDICRDIRKNKLFIIPFNINEICVTPGDDICLKSLIEILYKSNSDLDTPNDFLSNNIYCFDKKRGVLSKAAAYDKRVSLN